VAPVSSSGAGQQQRGGEAWDYLQHLQTRGWGGCSPRMAMLCREGQVHGASAMAELAAALVAKGAAETVGGRVSQKYPCERIGDARHRPCAEASSVPLDYLAQAQDTLRYEGIDEC